MTFNERALLPVRAPFRLDLTAAALRRLAANVVDVVDEDGTYYRAFADDAGTTLAAVRPRDETRLEVRTTGERGMRWLPTIARMLGVDADLRDWRRRSAKIPWLRPLARSFDGVKPPRYVSVWEACAHAIVFQQISIYAAGAIMRRAIEALSGPAMPAAPGDTPRLPLPFPSARRWLEAPENVLRAAGLSANKVAHLRSVAAAFEAGALQDAQLERLPTAAAAERLRAVRGIGPWSASVVLLRGLGRLDTFPMRDSGVARSVVLLAGRPIDLDAVLEILGPVRGMLYYHLLLGRLATARGVERS
ncbi:MAG TPA: hypothetical protein VMF61_13110 [Candidatus Acidoferrales bacterium]|nr:hypothetical protein [Candidatus Acidoferrales bacterium]